MKLISISPFVSLVLIPLLAISPLGAQYPAAGGSAPVTDSAAVQDLQLRVVDGDASETRAGTPAVKGFTVEVTDSAGAPVADAAIAARLPDSGPTGVFADGTHAAIVYSDAAGRARITGIRWGETPGLVALRVTATKGTSHAGILVEQTLTGTETHVATAVPTSAATATPASAPPPVSVTVVPRPRAPAELPAQGATAQLSPKALPPIAATKTIAKPVAAQETPTTPPPAVTVTNTAPGEAPHKSHAKWLILALVAAGAGAGVAMAGKGKSSSPSAPAATLSIGNPTISVGGGH